MWGSPNTLRDFRQHCGRHSAAVTISFSLDFFLGGGLLYLRDHSAQTLRYRWQIKLATCTLYLRDHSAQTLRYRWQIKLATCTLYLRDHSAQTLRYRWQIKLASSPRHSTLTPGQPVLALTLYHPVHGRAAARVPVLK